MKAPKQLPLSVLQAQVDMFNLKHSQGVLFQAQQTKTSPWIDVTVRHEATILGGHTAVGWFNELSGCHSLDFVREKPAENV